MYEGFPTGIRLEYISSFFLRLILQKGRHTKRMTTIDQNSISSMNATMSSSELEAREGSTRSINRQPYLKILFFFKKLPSVSDEYFHTHWSTFHADLSMSAKPFLISSKRYVQFHADKRLAASIPGMIPLDFDGCSELWVKDFKAWQQLQDSPEYANAFTG